jgi:hypothetical protein
MLGVLLLSPAAMRAAPAASAPSMTGLWKVTGDVMGTPVRMMCNLTETNHTLSGVCSGEQDGYSAHKIAGTVKASKAEFHFQTAFGGNPLTLIVSGTTNEDMSRMDGGLDVEPMAVGGSFTAVREQEDQAAADAAADPASATATQPSATTTPAATDSPSPTLQPVVTGNWKIDCDLQGTPVKMMCALSQAEHRLTGTCTAEGDDTPRALAGTTTEQGLGWRFDADYQGQPITVTMRATLTSDGKMNGTLTVAPMNAEGTFAGVKQ